jgi:hypothetical protein
MIIESAMAVSGRDGGCSSELYSAMQNLQLPVESPCRVFDGFFFANEDLAFAPGVFTSVTILGMPVRGLYYSTMQTKRLHSEIFKHCSHFARAMFREQASITFLKRHTCR